jgi:Protein of unknown function (DUF433)
MRKSAELDKARALVVEDPEIFSGTPVIRNTRIPVYDTAASVAAGLPMHRRRGVCVSRQAEKRRRNGSVGTYFRTCFYKLPLPKVVAQSTDCA